MIHNKFRYLLTLVALFAISTGAWAETVFEFKGSTADPGTLTLGSTGMSITTLKIHTNTDDIAGIRMGNDYVYADGKYFTIKPATGSFKKGDKLSIAICYNKDGDADYAKAVIYAADHETLLYTTNDGINGRTSADEPAVEEYVLTQDAECLYIGRYGKTATFVTTLKVERPSLDVTWDAATKTGTFTMPACDVELTPQYAPTAKWATEGDKVLAPTAAEDAIAGTEAPIIVEGTVAKIGETENLQGQAMYFATTEQLTAEQAAKADGWLSAVPTAKGYDDATTVYVWYYIKGADAPQGQAATELNTFNDSELTYLKVQVLTNKFDIQFNAANANTIESGKATVKVGETAAEVKEGKLTGVKMGSKVTITAKDGYKFRKVEATKGISTLKSVKIGNYTVYYAEGETWYQAFWRDENNNCGLTTSVGRVFTYNNKSLRDSDGDVYADAVIDPSKGYYIAD